MRSVNTDLAALLVTACGLLLGLPQTIHAQALSVGESSAVLVGDGAIELCCADLEIGGTLDLESGSVSLVAGVHILSTGNLLGTDGELFFSGPFQNQGTLNAGNSQILPVADCGAFTPLIIPTVSPVGLATLATFMALAALLLLRRRRAVPTTQAIPPCGSDPRRSEKP